MKKNRIILIITVVLAAVAIGFYITGGSGTIKQELKDFAVKDTNTIDKIFMADRSGNKVLLEKKGKSYWMLNGKYQARQNSINTLLYTIASLDVRNPVAKAAYNNVVKQLASNGIKIEIYQAGERTKTYYVGGPTQDQMGTFMLLENSSTPFVMYIPGFDGYLTPRYFTQVADWRDMSIFRYQQGEIRKIEVSYNEAPDNSFVVEASGEDSYVLKDTKGNSVNIDPAVIRNYVASYKDVNMESFIDPVQKDSILKKAPAIQIRVTGNGNLTRTLKLYHKPNDTGSTDDHGKLNIYDIERMYATVDDKDFCSVQFFAVNRLLKSIHDLGGSPR